MPKVTNGNLRAELVERIESKRYQIVKQVISNLLSKPTDLEALSDLETIFDAVLAALLAEI